MKIETEDDVRTLAVRQLRESLNLTQKVFWETIGVTSLRGHRYENGLTKKIPRDVRRLVFLHYVVGFPTDAAPEKLRELMGRCVDLVNRDAVKSHLDRASSAINDARGQLDA